MYRDFYREVERELMKEIDSSKRFTFKRLIKIIGLSNVVSEQKL